jgi:hypothetical protein
MCVKCRGSYTCHCELLSEQLPAPPPPQQQQKQIQESQRKVIDVYGQQIESICKYRRCKHKFSVHGYDTHKCKCRHALNYAAGISLKIEV